jgi:large subunit ribosomal protein L31e
MFLAEEEKKERLLTVPLRFPHNQPRTKRADLAVTFVRKFVGRHMKVPVEKVWMDPGVNEVIWARGKQKPPAKIKVRAEKFPDGQVEVSIPEE